MYITGEEYRAWKTKINEYFREDVKLMQFSFNVDDYISRIFTFMSDPKNTGKLYDTFPDDKQYKPERFRLSDNLEENKQEISEILVSLSVLAERGGIVVLHYDGKKGDRLVSAWRLKADPDADMNKEEDGPIKAEQLAELGLLQPGETAVIAAI